MCIAQGPQHSDAGEARTRGPSVSSQALYHWATALPICLYEHTLLHVNCNVYRTCLIEIIPLRSCIDSVVERPRIVPYGKKCTAANNFREQLANTLRILWEYSAIAR